MKTGWLFILAAVSAGCGGSEPSPASPKADTEAAPVRKARGGTSDESRSSALQCDDGSCFACGDAICLVGFYCTVGKAGRGCAWLPSCASKASCACITPMLREEPSCTCQEKEGGVYVTCDGARL